MSKFDVLGTMRAIREDESLSSTQAHLLMCAALRTDNDSCKVRMSIEGLAKDAKRSDKTARTAFQQPQVLRYMQKVEGATSAKNMWFHPTPVVITGVGEASTPVTGDQTPVTEGPTPVTDDRTPVKVTGHLPSTSTDTSTSTSTSKSPVVADAPTVDPTVREDSPTGTFPNSESGGTPDRPDGPPSALVATGGTPVKPDVGNGHVAIGRMTTGEDALTTLTGRRYLQVLLDRDKADDDRRERAWELFNNPTWKVDRQGQERAAVAMLYASPNVVNDVQAKSPVSVPDDEVW